MLSNNAKATKGKIKTRRPGCAALKRSCENVASKDQTDYKFPIYAMHMTAMPRAPLMIEPSSFRLDAAPVVDEAAAVAVVLVSKNAAGEEVALVE